MTHLLQFVGNFRAAGSPAAMFGVAALALAVPSISFAVCGDGARDVGEACDDGNLIDDDGCSSSCTIEDGFRCVSRVDFASAQLNGVDGGANWSIVNAVTADVTNNAQPTVLVSQESAFAGTTEISIRTTNNDDDFIGLALGITNGEFGTAEQDFLLIDWKRGFQDQPGYGIANLGLALSYVVGGTATRNDFWQHANNVNELARGATLGNAGWVQNATHVFVVTYRSNRLEVSVDGVVQFDVTPADFGLDAFPDGNVGLYNFSQPNTRYTWLSPSAASQCDPVCGDGLTKGEEACDDGGLVDGDGCSSECEIEPGFTCTTLDWPGTNADDWTYDGAPGSGDVCAGTWLVPPEGVTWITPVGCNGTPGLHDIETTLTIPTQVALDNFELDFRVAVDNVLRDVYVNDVSQGITAAGFTAFTALTLTNTDFVVGVNTLRFEVEEFSVSPTGLLLVVDGASSTSNGDTFCYDTPPSPALVTVDPDQVFSVDQPVITGTYDSSQLAELVVSVDGVSYVLSLDVELQVDGLGGWALDLSAGTQQLADGTYDVSVTQTDAEGSSTSDSTVDEVDIDVLPTGVSVDDAQSFAVNQPTITGTYDQSQLDLGQAGALTVTVDGTTYTLGVDAALTVTAGGQWSLNLGATSQTLADGVYPVRVNQIDPQNNEVDDTEDITVDVLPVGVAVNAGQSFAVTSPLITGTYDPTQLDALTVTVNGVTYTNSVDVALSVDPSGTWALQIPVANALPEGSLPVTVTQTDAEGNEVFDTKPILVDVLPNAALVTVNPGQTFAVDQPTITGTYDPGQLDTLTVNVGGVTYTLGTDAELTITTGGAWSLALSAGANLLVDDTYLVTVTQTDAEGNPAGATGDITVDVLPATPTVNTQLTNNPSPTLTGGYGVAQFSGLTVSINGVTYSDNDAVVLDGAGGWTLDLDAAGQVLPEGVYNVTVTAVDPQGNSAADLTNNEVEIDLTPPDAPTVNELATSDTTPTVQGSYDAADSVTLTVTINGTTYTLGDDPELTVNTATGTWTLQLNGTVPLADGTYVVVVETADRVDNLSSGSGEVIIDSSLPIAPTVDALLTNSPEPTLTGTYDGAGAVGITIVVGGLTFIETDAAVTLDPATGDWSLDLTGSPLADGTYDVVVTTTNQVGTAAVDTTTNELVIDATPPLAPTVAAVFSDDGRPLLFGTYDASDLGDFSVTVDGVTYFFGTNPELSLQFGVWTLDLTGIPDPLAEGLYDVAVVQIDDAGNVAFDLTTDELEVLYPIPGQPTVNALVSTDGLPLITGTYDPTLTISMQVTVNGVTYTQADSELTLNADGTWALDLTGLPVALADGTYAVDAVISDGFGVEISDPTTDELLVDATPPAVPTVTSLVTNVSAPTIEGTYDADDLGTVEVTVNGTTYTVDDAELTLNPDGTWSLDLPALSDGTYEVVVVQTDDAGNATADTTNDELVIDATPPVAPTVNAAFSTDGRPLITGTYDVTDSGTLVVTVNGESYTAASPELTLNVDGTWSLDLSGLDQQLASGFYDVEAVHTDAAGNVAVDQTVDELEVDLGGDTADTANFGELPGGDGYYSGGGCACSSSGSSPVVWLGLLPLLGLLRRRR